MLTKLNQKQKEAVITIDGPVSVVAGAGSGKTRVLTHRIAFLIKEKKAFLGEILAVTFTNKAAKEMKARILGLLEGDYSDKELASLWISTFHSICARILRIDAEKIGLSNNFVIYDMADQKSVVKKILKELEIDEKQFKPSSFLSAISSAKSEMIEPAEYEKTAIDPFSKKVHQVYIRYRKELLKQNAVDFDDLLLYTAKLLRENKTVLAKYQKRFKYVLVDEYQDTNSAQYEIVSLISKGNGNLCVVGDTDQNIYSWRGATIENLDRFDDDFPKRKAIVLDQNYRSTPNILRVANDVIACNPNRQEKNLWTDNAEGENVVHYVGINERDEGEFLVSEIRDLMAAKGYDYKDCAILYRTNAQSRIVEEMFMKHTIPYQIIGAYRFYERKEIKDVLSYLRVIYNPNDIYSLTRSLSSVVTGVGKTSLAKLELYADENGISMFDALGNIELLRGRASKGAEKFYRITKSLQAVLAEKKLDLQAFIKHALTEIGYMDILTASEDKESKDRLENVMEFISVAGERQDVSLEDFLMDISLVSDIDSADDEKDAVTLMTLHSAKGLEFPVVFMIGMEEGLLPHFRTLLDMNEVQEERRLCYVGMTRAEEVLYLTSVVNRTLMGSTSSNELSRFMKEVSEKNITKKTSPRLDASNKKYNFVTESGVVFSKKSTEDYKEQAKPADDFSLGDVVIHPSFGKGSITELRGDWPDTMVTVKFAFENKTLMLKFAPLSKA